MVIDDVVFKHGADSRDRGGLLFPLTMNFLPSFLIESFTTALAPAYNCEMLDRVPYQLHPYHQGKGVDHFSPSTSPS